MTHRRLDLAAGGVGSRLPDHQAEEETLNTPEDPTLADEEIETTPLGNASPSASDDDSGAGDDGGVDDGGADDSGDAADTGDDTGDVSDPTDTGDDSGDSGDDAAA
jgi:hypothetical protein